MAMLFFNALTSAVATTAFSSFVDGVVITVGTYAITKGAKNVINIKK